MMLKIIIHIFTCLRIRMETRADCCNTWVSSPKMKAYPDKGKIHYCWTQSSVLSTPQHPFNGAARLISSSCIAGSRVGEPECSDWSSRLVCFPKSSPSSTHAYKKRSHAQNTCLLLLVLERMDTHTHTYTHMCIWGRTSATT